MKGDSYLSVVILAEWARLQYGLLVVRDLISVKGRKPMVYGDVSQSYPGVSSVTVWVLSCFHSFMFFHSRGHFLRRWCVANAHDFSVQSIPLTCIHMTQPVRILDLFLSGLFSFSFQRTIRHLPS